MRAILLCLLLAGCASGPQIAVQAPTCPSMRTYSAAEQSALADAVAALAAGSPLIWAVEDYAALRASVRACQAVAK